MLKPQKYRERSIATVEAIQWDGSEKSQAAIVTWAGGMISGWFDSVYFLEIRTPHGRMRADVNDWITRNTRGQFYPLSPLLFNHIYESDPD